MVTGFSLTQGYCYAGDQEITIKQLHDIAKEVGKNQKAFYCKCLEYGLKEDLDGGKLSDLLAKYKYLPTEDGTCEFVEWGVLQSCYGGSGCRFAREIICRAFGVLVLDACYKKGYSVSFTIL